MRLAGLAGVDLGGYKLIEEVDVFSMQDNYGSPVEPTPDMTFVSWGLRAFERNAGQLGLGPIPGASVTTNTLVWRQFVFVPLATTKIRVFVTGALNGYSRMMEVEAWGVPAAGDPPGGPINQPPAVAITTPADGEAFTTPVSLVPAAQATDTDGDRLTFALAFYQAAC